MPSKSRRQHNFFEAIAHDPAFAKRAGVAQSVGRDFTDADKAAGKFKPKGKPKMAKHSKHHALSGHGAGGDDGVMGGAAGMSPRKAMASGKGDGGGNFGVEAFEHGAIGHAGQHPDARAMTGAKPHLADHERAIGHPIHHSKDHHPAQAAPSHGPHHPGGHMRSEHGRFHDMAGKHKAG